MKIIKQSWNFEESRDTDFIHLLEKIERAARTCYQTDYAGSDDFIRKLIKSGHHSTLEHASITVRIITDRGVTHELVRHRIASYSQESTRYCNYSKDKFGGEITVILPTWLYNEYDMYESLFEDLPSSSPYWSWISAMQQAETYYFDLLQKGWSAQQARTVLPNSLKTEIVTTMNIREWRHFFNLRTSPAAHPQMRELALDMLSSFKTYLSVLFEDIVP